MKAGAAPIPARPTAPEDDVAHSPLHDLARNGQSIWLDNLSRPMLSSGHLARLVREDAVTGVTSNPAIFHAAITGSDAYDDRIRALAGDGLDPSAIYEELAIADVRDAADVLRPVYERTRGEDGFVSLEVSPHLARDTRGTIAEAERLWRAVDRPNLLIKIPGTDEGTPAIRTCLERGIAINVTLLFAREAHDAVIHAYLDALGHRRERGEPLGVASVASFFVSRIDVMVDRMLEERVAAGRDADAARLLLGRVAIANARLAYAMWKERFAGGRWEALAAAGARVQKSLWASTSTKNPAYRDVVYVEALVGRDTIDTMPEETLDAFRDHGIVVPDAVEHRLDEQRQVFRSLASLGIDFASVTDALVEEGIAKFVQPFDRLLEALEDKRRSLAR
jgi:transaldolase